ncbi:hypothetical protein HBB16_01170 [Pseudonocardia sp. MCCB 268]|nr:hypothetical protein [Pseudonocardia cytotoxica]
MLIGTGARWRKRASCQGPAGSCRARHRHKSTAPTTSPPAGCSTRCRARRPQRCPSWPAPPGCWRAPTAPRCCGHPGHARRAGRQCTPASSTSHRRCWTGRCGPGSAVHPPGPGTGCCWAGSLLRGATSPAEDRLAAVGAETPVAFRSSRATSSSPPRCRWRSPAATPTSALMRAWTRARQAIVRHPVDLFVLQPLGELVTAATGCQESWVAPHLDEATALLNRLG